MGSSVLVVAAHPDDEVLGCGGTIAKLSREGARVHVAFLADGVLSRQGGKEAMHDELGARRVAAREASGILGASSVSFGEFPDNRMDEIGLLDVVLAVEALINEHQPDVVLTHHAGDVNVDHRKVHEAVVVACRPQQGRTVKLLLCFEVPSSTEWQLPGSGPGFTPNWFVDITSTFGEKLSALGCYSGEMRPWPHPRSIQGVTHLVHWRGATVGVEAAEAFMLGRNLA